MSALLVLLRLDRSRARAWHGRMIQALMASGATVRVEAVDDVPLPGSVAILFKLEGLVLRRGKADGSDPVDIATLGSPLQAGETPDLAIDLATSPSSKTWPTLRALHEGEPGEDAVIGVLLAGVVPVSEIVDAATGQVVERAHASMEGAGGHAARLGAIGARLSTVLLAQVRSRIDGRQRPLPPAIASPAHGPARSLARIAMRMVASQAASKAYRLSCYAPHWRTGWRLHDGPGVIDTGDLSGPAFRVLPERVGHFYADPFPVTWKGQTAIFVEDLDHRSGKGVIVAIPFDETGPSSASILALEEPWHLSYPFLVEHKGELYMIPESSAAGTVELYRCTGFPGKWQHCATLLSGLTLGDATLIEREGRWWMFGALHDGGGGWSDTLALFSAPDLFGPWRAHDHSPIFVDRSQARPAGAIVEKGGRLFRPVQDCSIGYGSRLGLAEITRLDDGGFAQVLWRLVGPGAQWPGRKLHTLNRHGRLEVIDGSVIRPKSPFLAGLVERRTRPRGAAN